MCAFKGLETQRGLWHQIYDQHYTREDKFRDYSLKCEIFGLIFSILYIFPSFFIIGKIGTVLEIIILLIITFNTILVLIIEFYANEAHTKAELGRRTSFYVGFGNTEKLIEIINSINDNNLIIDPNTPQWYTELDAENKQIQLAQNCYESMFYTDELLAIEKRNQIFKLFIPTIMLIILTFSFIISIVYSSSLTILLFIPLLFVILSYFLNSLKEFTRFAPNQKKITEIRLAFKLLIVTGRSKKYFIYECFRLEMEYSIIKSLIPKIPFKIYLKLKDKLERKNLKEKKY